MKEKAEDKIVEKESTIQDAARLEQVLRRVAELEEKDKKNQAQLKMLYEVADKGRVFNYETSRAEKKPTRVRLSIYNENTIIGWRTLKDELIKHPTTGKTVGENQEYELLLMDKLGNVNKAIVSGYPAFSDARYTERIDCDVIGRKEDYQGNVTLEVMLPTGKVVSLDARFVN